MAAVSAGARHLRVPLDGVAPGAYIAHAVVRAGGDVIAERTRQVEVMAGDAPVAAPAPRRAARRADRSSCVANWARYLKSLADAAATPFADGGRRAANDDGRGRSRRSGAQSREATPRATRCAAWHRFVREDYAAPSPRWSSRSTAAPTR